MHKKKWIRILLLMCLFLTGCGGKNTSENTLESGNRKTEEMSMVSQETGSKAAVSDYADYLEVHYIDVGQGDATLIKCGEHAMLIDGGNNHMGTTVQLYLKNQKVETLDYVIGTHPDADHIGGLDVITYKYDCGTIIMPDYEKDTKTYQELLDVLKEKRYKITYPIPGKTYTLGEAEFTILAPNSNDYGNNANEYSVALRLVYGQTAFLFTGDAEEKSEEEMLQSGLELSSNVYKTAHHGSSSASTGVFLDVVQPAYAVISCGEDNSYGHPHAEVLNRLRQRGIQVFRTDEQGSIIAVSDGEKITFNCAADTSWKAGEPSESDREEEVVQDSIKVEYQEGMKETSGTQSKCYVLNTNTKKFHLPECQSVAKIQKKNYQKLEEHREELMDMGYEPCKNCNP